MKRIYLCLTLCLLPLLYWGCPNYNNDSNTCNEYQDVARVDIVKYANSPIIDSVVMKTNDSVIGCHPTSVFYDERVKLSHRQVIGSATHRVSFPIIVRLQLFSQGDLLKELSFAMSKNMVAKVYRGSDCPKDTDSSPDRYCLFFENLEFIYNQGCVVYFGHGEQDLCTIDTRPVYIK
jgi:hypothetical protein